MKTNLTLEGGGIKGLSYIGALRCLEENGYEIDKVCGSSVGAIFACLISVGYDSYDLENIVNNISLDVLLPPKNNITNVIKNKGLYSMKALEELLENLCMLKGKKNFSDIRIGNFYKASMVTTSLKYHRMLILPYDLKLLGIDIDSFSIAKAACMSASIPLFYEPYIINGYKFVDGGVSDNFPYWIHEESIALKINRENKKIDFIKKRIFGSVNKISKVREIFIDVSDYKATEFKKGLENKYDLYNRGYFAVKNGLIMGLNTK